MSCCLCCCLTYVCHPCGIPFRTGRCLKNQYFHNQFVVFVQFYVSLLNDAKLQQIFIKPKFDTKEFSRSPIRISHGVGSRLQMPPPPVVAAVSDRWSTNAPDSHRAHPHWGCGRPRPHKRPAKHGLHICRHLKALSSRHLATHPYSSIFIHFSLAALQCGRASLIPIHAPGVGCPLRFRLY